MIWASSFSDRNHTWPFQRNNLIHKTIMNSFSDRNHTWPFQRLDSCWEANHFSFSDRNHTWPFQLLIIGGLLEEAKFQWSKSYMAIPTDNFTQQIVYIEFQWSKSYMAIPTLQTVQPVIQSQSFSDRNHTWPFQLAQARLMFGQGMFQWSKSYMAIPTQR